MILQDLTLRWTHLSDSLAVVVRHPNISRRQVVTGPQDGRGHSKVNSCLPPCLFSEFLQPPRRETVKATNCGTTYRDAK